MKMFFQNIHDEVSKVIDSNEKAYIENEKIKSMEVEDQKKYKMLDTKPVWMTKKELEMKKNEID